MKCIIRKPYQEPFIHELNKDDLLREMQSIVNGYIEIIQVLIGKDDNKKYYDIVLDDEGKYHDLSPNAMLIQNNKVYDIIVGTIIITAHDGKGETIGLSDDEIKHILDNLECNNDLLKFKTGDIK